MKVQILFDRVNYPWSSYLSCISIKPTKLQRETVIGWSDDLANFKTAHNQKIDVKIQT